MTIQQAKILPFLLLLVIFLGCLCAFPASAKSYYYHLIEVDIQVDRDSTFDVVERQTYLLNGSFGYFIREIALKDLDHISGIEVFDSDDRRLSNDEYETYYEGNRRVVKWNFPRRMFNNELKFWTVKYKVHGAINFYKGTEGIYWNAVFPDREVPVKRAEAIVSLPQPLNEEDIAARLFIGQLGNKIQSQNKEIIDGQTVRFWGENILPEEYLTVVVDWPAGLVKKPFLYRNQIINWTVLLIAFGLPVFLFIKRYLLWKEKGKDPKIEKTIMAEYSPPEPLPSAIFGVLIDQEIQMKDITATIIDLAARGYIRIIEEGKSFGFFKAKEYLFQKLKEPDQELNNFERKVMKSILHGKDLISMEDVSKRFYRKISDIKESLYREVEKTGYFYGNISTVRKQYGREAWKIFILSVFLFVAGLISLFAFPQIIRFFVYFLILEISLIISGIIVMVFAYYMPVMTQKGVEAKWKLLGFKEYLQKAEKFRMEKETVDTFSRLLPYALVLGVEKQWADRFSEIGYEKQDWYVAAYSWSGSGSGDGGVSSFSDFSASINSFTSSISRSLGGGSSGSGGAGGGGGGAGGGGGGGGGGAG